MLTNADNCFVGPLQPEIIGILTIRFVNFSGGINSGIHSGFLV